MSKAVAGSGTAFLLSYEVRYSIVSGSQTRHYRIHIIVTCRDLLAEKQDFGQ